MTRNVESFATILLRKAYTLATMLMEDETSRLDRLTREIEDSPIKKAIVCNLNIAKSCYEKCALNLEQIALRMEVADDRFYNGNRDLFLDYDSDDSLYSAMNILLEEIEDEDCRDCLIENKRMLDFLRG